jgi:hypothetical protein
MSRKGRLACALVLALIGMSSLFMARVTYLGMVNELKVSNIVFVPYLAVAGFLTQPWRLLYAYHPRSISGAIMT